MSETASGAACKRRNSRKPHSVGKPVWGVQLRVVGPDGEPLPADPDSVGEILISGHNVIEGLPLSFRAGDCRNSRPPAHRSKAPVRK